MKDRATSDNRGVIEGFAGRQSQIEPARIDQPISIDRLNDASGRIFPISAPEKSVKSTCSANFAIRFFIMLLSYHRPQSNRIRLIAAAATMMTAMREKGSMICITSTHPVACGGIAAAISGEWAAAFMAACAAA